MDPISWCPKVRWRKEPIFHFLKVKKTEGKKYFGDVSRQIREPKEVTLKKPSIKSLQNWQTLSRSHMTSENENHNQYALSHNLFRSIMFTWFISTKNKSTQEKRPILRKSVWQNIKLYIVCASYILPLAVPPVSSGSKISQRGRQPTIWPISYILAESGRAFNAWSSKAVDDGDDKNCHFKGFTHICRNSLSEPQTLATKLNPVIKVTLRATGGGGGVSQNSRLYILHHVGAVQSEGLMEMVIYVISFLILFIIIRQYYIWFDPNTLFANINLKKRDRK